MAKAVANVFDDVDALFCSSWGFLRPYFGLNIPYYRVNLVESDAFAGITFSLGSESSCINIAYDTANNIFNKTGITAYPNAYRGVVAHEYMHAIFYRYGIINTTTDQTWMHESFASWAGMAYEPDYTAFKTDSIKSFLKTTWRPLNYFTNSGDNQYRHYGSCLFPLYIQQEMGGYSTIKEILSRYSSSKDPFTAIDAGLKYYGYSLAEAYAGCASYNFDTGYFYSIAPKMSSSWGRGDIYRFSTYPHAPSAAQSVSPLACHYANFEAPVDTTSTLTITIDYSSIPSGATAILKTIRTTASKDYYITDRTITSNRCTIVQYNFGNRIAEKIAIIPINAGLSNSLSYTRTATIKYIEP